MAIVKKGNNKEELYRFLERHIEKAANAKTLDSLYVLHRQVWSEGIRHEKFSPSENGHFRCSDISSMSKSDVFLGGLSNVKINSLEQFERLKLSGFLDDKTQGLILGQYRNILVSGLKSLRNEIYDCGVDLMQLEGKICDILDDLRPKDAEQVHFVFFAHGFTPGEMKHYRVKIGDREYSSSLLFLLDEGRPMFFIPSAEHWKDKSSVPYVKDVSQLKDFSWLNISDGNNYSISKSFFTDRFQMRNKETGNRHRTESISSQQRKLRF